LKFLVVFKSTVKNNKNKLMKNGNFYAKSVFDKIVFGFCRNFNQWNYVEFSQNICIRIFYTPLNFQNILNHI